MSTFYEAEIIKQSEVRITNKQTEELLKHTRHSVFIIARKRGLNIEEAHDSASEFIVRLLEDQRMITPKIIAEHATRSLERNIKEKFRYRTRHQSIDDIEVVDTRDEQSLFDMLVNRWSVEIIYQAAAILKPQSRYLFQEYYLHGTELEPLAVESGLSIPALKRRLYRAHDVVRQILCEKYGFVYIIKNSR